jgi:hypothetical protein
MGAIGTAVTLLDLSKRMDANDKIAKIIEVLNKSNEIIQDALFVEGNLPTGHKTTVRAGLPTATWRKLNYGVQPTKSVTTQVTDTCGMLENYSQVDKALVDLANNKADFRFSEDLAFIEGMNQQFADTLIYGDTSVNPERFVGIAPRYSSLSAASGANIVSGGGSSALTSIYLVCWGPNTVHCIYPKGSQAGLLTEDKGQQTLIDAAGGLYEGYRTHYKWDVGFTVRDWRYIVRIANIDSSALTKNAASGADLIDLIAQAIELLPVAAQSSCTPVLYCGQKVRSFLRRQINNKSNVWLDQAEVGGQTVLRFGGIPVRRVDSITITETQVS